MPTLEAWSDQLSRFPAASPALVLRRELCRRTDSKYVMSPAAAADLVERLAGDYAVMTAGSGRIASYRTLYFDTDSLDFFHAHRCGRRLRHKVRIRHYPDRRVTRLEVKVRRSGLQTAKSWRDRTYGDDVLSPDDMAFVARHTGVENHVHPQVSTVFRRMTLVGTRTNERITIDLELCMETEARRKSLAPLAILEVKQWPFQRGTPVMSALRSAGHRPGWVSKYCAAIAFTRPDVRHNQLLPGLRALERGAA